MLLSALEMSLTMLKEKIAHDLNHGRHKKEVKI
jgi:hypothetical protein